MNHTLFEKAEFFNNKRLNKNVCSDRTMLALFKKMFDYQLNINL